MRTRNGPLCPPGFQRTEWVEGEILESHDDDPELLLHIPFDGAVKLKAVCVVGGTGVYTSNAG